jgi:hypothetical protein
MASLLAPDSFSWQHGSLEQQKTAIAARLAALAEVIVNQLVPNCLLQLGLTPSSF